MTIFSVLLALGAILGLAWVIYESPERAQERSLNAAILALFGALIGGRSAYVTIHWEYFRNNLFEIPQVWLGGLSWPGALAGGIVGTLLAAWIFKIPVDILADRLLPLLASVSVAVWLGCWSTGLAYGPAVNWGLSTKDEWGIWKQRLPLQLISAAISVAWFWGIELSRGRQWRTIPGLRASIGMGGLSLILLGASLLRVDPYPLYNGLRLETWAALFFSGIAAFSAVLTIVVDRGQS